MPRKLVSKTAFLGGEAGYLLEGRSDLAQHQLGGQEFLNFIVLKGGGITRRPGTRYVTGTLNNKPARLIDFVVSYDSGTDIYALEITLQSSTTLGFRVIRVSDNTVYSVSGSPLTISALSMTADQLSEIQYAQVGETMFIVHKNFPPQIFQRTASTPTFQITPYILYATKSRALAASVPYRDVNVDTSLTLTVSAATVGTGRTMTASAPLFNAGHVGAIFASNISSTIGSALVTGYTDSTHVTVQILDAWGGVGPTDNWYESAWSSYRGFPRTVTLYNQRTIFGGNAAELDTFWASQTANYFKMSALGATVTADIPQTFALASNKPNQIRWMVGGKKLTIGTSSSEWVGVFTESSDGSSTQVQFDEQTTHGSAPVQSRRSGQGVPFVQRGGQMVREIVFDFYSDTYVATDLSLFASHVATAYGRYESASNPHIVQSAYQDAPFNVIWFLDSLGRLYGITRDKGQQIAAWHSHSVGGKMTEALLTGLSGPDYPAMIQSIASIPDPNGQNDRIWMVVRRAINGADAYYIEYMDDVKPQPYITAGTTGDIRCHLDCASYQTGAASVSWGGYTRFANETVYVIAQNLYGAIAYAGSIAVDGSGNITLPAAATSVCVGLEADAHCRLLPFEGGGDGQPFYMRAMKRADTAAIRLHQTYGLRIGKNRIMRKTGWEDQNSFEPIQFDVSSAPPFPTFTGIKEVKVPTDVDFDGSFALAMTEPWPCTILSICSRVVENEV